MKTRPCAILLMSLLTGAALILGGWRAGYYLPEKTEPGKFEKLQRSVAEVRGDQSLPPHTAAFKFTALHGSEFIKNRQVCKTCHGEDLKGGLFKSACSKCHVTLADFAHFTGDITSTHGAAYLKNPAGCKFCHGSDLEGSGTAIGCRNCHNYPHSMRWSLPSEHGQAFLKIQHHEDSPIGPACEGCHAKNGDFQKKYPDKFVACDTCHLEMPHPGGDDWARRGLHKEAAKTYEGKCGHCHRGYNTNLPRFHECRVCHPAPDSRTQKWQPILKFEKPGEVSENARKTNRSVASKPAAETAGAGEPRSSRSSWRHHGY